MCADGRWDSRTGLVCPHVSAPSALGALALGYGVGRIGADASYDASSAVGLVRAAERAKSPAILQLFPISLEYGGVAYLRYCVEL